MVLASLLNHLNNLYLLQAFINFGRTTAEMGSFSQKGLCFSVGIFHGLLSNKNIRNPIKKIIVESPLHPQLTLF